MRGSSDAFGRAVELMRRSEEPEPPLEEEEAPGRVPDAEGEASIWDRVAEVADIAPVHGDPSMEPADSPWEVAMMAGWGDVDDRGRGHDAMMGVDRMVTGDVDAMRELHVDSATRGGPLTLERSEDMDTRIDPGEELGYADQGDWTTHL